MRLIAAAFIVLTVCIPTSSRAEGEAAALGAICDQAAASPLDTKRPAGAAGVAADKVDPKIAIPACEAAAKAAPDDPRIAFQLGRAYGAAKAYESSRAQYEKADAAGYALATNNLAAYYSDGLGIPADPTRGISLLEKAANGGVGIAMNSLGLKYHDDTSLKDLTLARRWWQKGAEAGDASAIRNFGVALWKGEGGPKDLTEARRWFKKGAEAGNPASMNDYGLVLQNGEGGYKDLVEARRWLQKGAEAGNAVAMNNYGVLLARGLGGPKNDAEAVRWYEKAAALGEEMAKENLATRKAQQSTSSGRRAGSSRSYSSESGGGSSSSSSYRRPGSWGTTGSGGMGIRPGTNGFSSYGPCHPYCY